MARKLDTQEVECQYSNELVGLVLVDTDVRLQQVAM